MKLLEKHGKQQMKGKTGKTLETTKNNPFNHKHANFYLK
jgi:hypothetical protein